MPRPTAPQTFAAGTTSGGVANFTRQPSYYEWLEAPTLGRTDGGAVANGLPGIVLVWRTLKPAEWDELVAHYNAAVAQAHYYYLRYWEETASSGAGAYATVKCGLWTRPMADRDATSPNWMNVRMTFKSLGLA